MPATAKTANTLRGRAKRRPVRALSSSAIPEATCFREFLFCQKRKLPPAGQALDAWAKAQFAAITPARRRVITSHDAFGYFGAQYQVKFLAPQGVSTDAEPSARQIAQLIRQIQREKIRAVSGENMGSPRLLAQLSQDAGMKPGLRLYVDALSAAGGPAGTYLKLMRHNVAQLAAGMQQN